MPEHIGAIITKAYFGLRSDEKWYFSSMDEAMEWLDNRLDEDYLVGGHYTIEDMNDPDRGID